MNGYAVVGAQAKRLLWIVNTKLREEELQSINLSDREMAHVCGFPLKYLAVAKLQLEHFNLLRITRGKNRAIYEPCVPMGGAA